MSLSHSAVTPNVPSSLTPTFTITNMSNLNPDPNSDLSQILILTPNRILNLSLSVETCKMSSYCKDKMSQRQKEVNTSRAKPEIHTCP